MSKKEITYGVGFGNAMLSPEVGSLLRATRELGRLIREGRDPRSVHIVPVIRCPGCKSPRAKDFVCKNCLGFSFIVSNDYPALTTAANNYGSKNVDIFPTIRLCMMSKPGTTAADSRTWIVRKRGETPAMVHVHPRPFGRHFACDCKAADCWHVAAVRETDTNKFSEEK